MPDLLATAPETSLASRIVDLLAEEGYRPHLQESNGPWRRIEFKWEGARYIVRLNEEDPDFVQIALGYLLDEPASDPAAVLRAGHDVQAEAKVAKFFLDPECRYYEMQAELFLGGRTFTAQHLERSLGALKRAAAELEARLGAPPPRARA
jgi:hypothetical protein